MNKMKTLEYSRKVFRIEILIQALLLLNYLLSPIKLVSIMGSITYIIFYILFYKMIIKKADMKQLLVYNVIFNLIPALLGYMVIVIKYDESLTNFGLPIFTILCIISIVLSYRFTMLKSKLGIFKGIFIIPFIVSQFMINSLGYYTVIMIIYILLVFLIVRYPLECYRMYKNNEEYIYY